MIRAIAPDRLNAVDDILALHLTTLLCLDLGMTFVARGIRDCAMF
jgi:hypothetical protein